MFRFILYLWTYFLGVRIFLYAGNRDDLVNIKECVIRNIQNHSIVFNFYEKKQINNMVKFGRVKSDMVTYYIIEAIFSDDFKDNFKQHNEIKYYIDFNSHGIFNKELVLDILLNRFIVYLEYKLR